MSIKFRIQERLLQECLEALARGEALEAILSRYPEHAAALRPRLQAAAWLEQRTHSVEPRPGWLPSAGQRLLADLRRQVTPRSQVWRGFIIRLSQLRRGLQGAVIALLVLLFLNVTGQALFAARPSLPGDFSYPLKRLQEQVRLALSLSPAQDARLNLHFAQQRTLELEELLLEGRYEDLPLAVALFQQQMDQFQQDLRFVHQHDPILARNLQQQMEDAFQEQQIVLSLLVQNTPPSVRTGLEQVLLALPR